MPAGALDSAWRDLFGLSATVILQLFTSLSLIKIEHSPEAVRFRHVLGLVVAELWPKIGDGMNG
jgi:hypothetical protein